MQKCFAIVASCCCLLLLCEAALKLPDFVKKCSAKDPNFDDCVFEHAKETIPHMIDGLKKYRIPVLDPIHVKEMRANVGGLDMHGWDLVGTGLRNVQLKNIKIDLKKKEITVEVLVPKAHFQGKYEVNGKVMSLPITGKGDFEATFDDLYAKYVTTYELQKMDDEEVYLVPTIYNVIFETKSANVRMDNLFNGNKLLGDNMNKFLNENWQDVMKEAGQSTYNALGLVIHNIFSGTTLTVAYKDVFDDVEV